MRLVFSTDEFLVDNVPVERFPILLSKNCEIVKPVLEFLKSYFLEKAGVESRNSWITYGYIFLDYFKYLERAHRSWDAQHLPGAISVLAAYRRQALRRGQAKSTLGPRLAILAKFYEFARVQGWVKKVPLPFEKKERVKRHSQAGIGPPRRVEVDVPVVTVKPPKKRLTVLTGAQSIDLLNAIDNPVHHLMVLFCLATGLRAEELCTFPLARIVDPRCHPKVRHAFRVTLDPREMATKGGVQRDIDIPRALMAELWAYAARERSSHGDVSHTRCLFVTNRGTGYSRKTLWFIVKTAAKKIGVKVSPHVLRHTYATHTLHALRSANSPVNGLLYVQARLGHAWLSTTQKYCHYIDDVAIDVINTYQRELLSFLDEQ